MNTRQVDLPIDGDLSKYNEYAGQFHIMQITLSKQLPTPASPPTLLDNFIQLIRDPDTNLTAQSSRRS